MNLKLINVDFEKNNQIDQEVNHMCSSIMFWGTALFHITLHFERPQKNSGGARLKIRKKISRSIVNFVTRVLRTLCCRDQ